MTPPTPGRPAAPVADFRRALAKSRLFDPRELDRLLAAAPHGADDAGLADHLVRAGVLTQFQAEKLGRGLWQGLVVGPYQLLCPLARGGMGIVYLARDARLPRPSAPVALKLLPPGRAAKEPRTLARFRREMEIGLALPPHPNVVPTTDAGEAGGVHYLAMEYAPGGTVRQRVAEGGTMPVGAACRVFADAAAGLSAAHLAGFVHRDFKPANLIVTPAGRGRVLDFGFALRVGEAAPADPTILGGQGYTLGTMDYLPPEQAADAAAVGPAADLYALGCSLYAALAGCPPFPGGGPQEKIRWHRTATPPPVAEVNPTVPAELDRVVAWLMAKRPASRPPSAEEAARHLLAWADPVAAETADPPPADELVRAAEARWQSVRGGTPGTAEEDALIIVDDATPAGTAVPAAPHPDAAEATGNDGRPPAGKRPPGRVPLWVWALAGGLLFATGAVFAAGVILAVWLARR